MSEKIKLPQHANNRELRVMVQAEKSRADEWKAMAENAISLLRNTRSPSLRIKEEKKKLQANYQTLLAKEKGAG